MPCTSSLFVTVICYVYLFVKVIGKLFTSVTVVCQGYRKSSTLTSKKES